MLSVTVKMKMIRKYLHMKINIFLSGHFDHNKYFYFWVRHLQPEVPEAELLCIYSCVRPGFGSIVSDIMASVEACQDCEDG